MSRIPYDMIVIEADRLFIQVIVARTPRQAHHYWKMYIGYITACGWTDHEFDMETLRRVDAAWESFIRIWN